MLELREIREAMEEHKLSRNQVGDMVHHDYGTSISTVTRCLRGGNATIDTVGKIQDCLRNRGYIKR